MTMTTARNLDPAMVEYLSGTAVCTRDSRHTMTNGEAHHSGWMKYDLHGWLCPTCQENLLAEKWPSIEHPTWCTNCEGYSPEDGSVDHQKWWRDDEGNPVITLSQCIGADGTVKWCEVSIDGVHSLTVADLRTLSTAMTDVADLIQTTGLELKPS